MGKKVQPLKKRENLIILFILAVITVNVWLELKIFDYMNSITKVIVAGGDNIKDILEDILLIYFLIYINRIIKK